MIKKKTTRNFLLWTASAICLALLAVALLFTGSFMKTSVAQAEGENDIAAKVENVETVDNLRKQGFTEQRWCQLFRSKHRPPFQER